MQTTQIPADVIDQILGIGPGDALHTLRHARNKVVQATQAFHELAFHAPGLSAIQRQDRFLVAALLADATGPEALATLYREQLTALQPSSDHVDVLAGRQSSSAALNALADYTRSLAIHPSTANREALLGLVAAGWSVPEIITLAQVIGYVSYQTRSIIGLKALQEAADITTGPGAESKDTGDFIHPAHLPPPGQIFEIEGFTNATLDWESWLPTQEASALTEDQKRILDTSHPKARESDYYMLLIQAPELLEQRSLVFNALMYAPGGASRAERELASTAVSRVNGCVYCASVHAQRFEQLTKRNDVIVQLFEAPLTAGTSARERAIVQMSIALTQTPATFGNEQIQPLLSSGVTPEQIRDIIGSAAIFAWANRLMLNLGKEVRPSI
ncbi:MAG: peroxidase-related enzyme [Alcaligenaceae bacterium]|nr:peroxidase-related enzyme [Alcaligenaceae bacterium]